MQSNDSLGIDPTRCDGGGVEIFATGHRDQRTQTSDELTPLFFDLPIHKRVKTPTGQSMLADSRNLFDFATEIIGAHDIFSKHWCRHAALIVMKRALVESEPLYRLPDDLLNQTGE